MEQVANEFKGRVKVFGMDVDQNPDTASSFGIMSIPAILIFKDGKEVGRLIGPVPKSRLIDELKRVA